MKKSFNQEEPRCVICSTSFYFRDPSNPYGAKCPHILQCGHSACEGCLISAFQTTSTLTCPVCSTVSETRKFSDPKNTKKTEMLSLRQEFPLNVYAVGQVSLKRNRVKTGESLIKFRPKNKTMDDPHTVNCNECNDRPADCSCRQCETELCTTCFSNIHNSVTLRKHEKICLKEKKTNELFEENMCKNHKGLFLNIFCKDCEIYICKDCIIDKKHLEHRCTDVFQQNEDKLPEFSELFDEANDILKQLYATKKKLQQPGTRGQVHDEEALKVERQVQSHYSFLHGILQHQEEELLKKIHTVGEMAHKSLENAAVDVEKNIKEIENILAVSSSTVTSHNIKEFPLDCLIEKLRNITGTPCHLVLNDEENSKFQFYVDANITKALAGHCTVTAPTNRVYELRSKCELPESYKAESLKNIPEAYLKPDLKHLIKNKEESPSVQKALLNAITTPSPTPSQPEAKTKPMDNPRKRASPQKRMLSGSVQSVSSQESFVDSLSKVQRLAEGTSEIVRMTHLLSPNSFYVHRKCSAGEIESMRDYFSKNMNRSKNPPAAVGVGKMYLVSFSQDDKWYRGRVVRVDGNFCDVFYVDYGNTEKRVPKSKLRGIPEKYMEIPDQALHCGLTNCTPLGGQWSSGANTLITNMAHNSDLSMYVERINRTTGFHEVHLRSVDETNGSLFEGLVYSGYAAMTESTATEQGLFKSAFVSRKNAFKNTVIKEHEVFDGIVTHIHTPSHFYMQKITDGGDMLMKMMTELSDSYSRYGVNEGLIFTPSVGMPVAARFQKDRNWYRAYILNVPEPRKVQVKYVDFGNSAILSIEDIRELQPKFLRMGAQALKCSLNDIASKHPKGWAASAKSAFENLVMNKGLLRVYVEKVNDDSLSIVLYETLPTKYINISGVLVKKGHATSTGLTSAQAEYACRPDYEVKLQHTDLPPSDSESVFSEYSSASKVSEAARNRKSHKRAKSTENEAFPVNGLDRNFSSRLDSIDQDQEIDGRVKVEVLKVISPSEIYFAFYDTPKQIDKMTNEMTAFYTAQPVEDREWSAGDLCAVLKHPDGKWYRGVITEFSHSNYKVFMKDIVEVRDVDRSMLRSLEHRFCKVTDGSLKVHLAGIRVPASLKVWPASTTDYLRRLIEESESLYIEKLDTLSNDSLPVRLWRRSQKQAGPLDPVTEEWCDMNNSLVELGFALLDSPPDDTASRTVVEEPNTEYVMNWLDNTFQAETLSVKSTTNRGRAKSRANRGRFPSQRATYIPNIVGPEGPEMVTEWKPAVPFKSLEFIGQPTYVDFDCNIYIQDIENCAPTLELLEKALLSLFGNSDKRPYEEEYLEGQICVAYFEPNCKWYRGQVLKVKPQHIEVLFVDYGNVEELRPGELRKQVTMGHIPVQCHKCRTEGIIPISKDGKWPIAALDFIHGVVVDQRCEVSLKAPTNTCEDYVVLKLNLPGGQDLLETLLSMHYATYIVDCERVGAADEDDEIIEDQEIQLAYSNNEASKALVQEIQSVCSSLENFKALAIKSPQRSKTEETVLIEDHVKSLQLSENRADLWYEMVEDGLEHPVSTGFISELDVTPRMDLRYRDMILPDSIVEFTVEVQGVVNYNSAKVMILECDDPEVMAFIKEFNKLQNLIQDEGGSLPALTHPVKGLVCLGCYTDDDTWYRAVIKDVLPDEGLVSVYYVDYGNMEEIPMTRLREIKPEWTLVPAQAIQVTLHNVRMGPNYEKLTCHAAYLNCLMAPPYTMAIESRFPFLEVELYNKDGELAYKPLLETRLITKE